MKRLLGLLSLASVVLFMGAGPGTPAGGGSTKAGKQSAARTQKTDTAAKSSPADGRGAVLFDTHCGRCHKPPEDLSPRVAPAVLSHMRTRAMLSREDEELILKFLAPQ